MVHKEMGIYANIYPLSTWERLISPPTMGRSLIDAHMDTSISPFFHLLAYSAVRADGRTMTMLPLHASPFTLLPDDYAKESTLTQSSFPSSITHRLSFPHLTTNFQSNRHRHSTYHLNNKQYADLRKSTPSSMLCWKVADKSRSRRESPRSKGI
jgi:hypothetical protein